MAALTKLSPFLVCTNNPGQDRAPPKDDDVPSDVRGTSARGGSSRRTHNRYGRLGRNTPGITTHPDIQHHIADDPYSGAPPPRHRAREHVCIDDATHMVVGDRNDVFTREISRFLQRFDH